MWFSTSSGRIEINITKKQAVIGSHAGDCEADVKYLRQIPAIKRQLDKIPADLLKNELKEYGAWDDEQRSDHDQNLTRILWLACCDISEKQNLK